MKKKLLFRLLVIMLATFAWSCANSSFDLLENDMAFKTGQELALIHCTKAIEKELFLHMIFPILES